MGGEFCTLLQRLTSAGVFCVSSSNSSAFIDHACNGMMNRPAKFCFTLTFRVASSFRHSRFRYPWNKSENAINRAKVMLGIGPCVGLFTIRLGWGPDRNGKNTFPTSSRKRFRHFLFGQSFGWLDVMELDRVEWKRYSSLSASRRVVLTHGGMTYHTGF